MTLADADRWRRQGQAASARRDPRAAAAAFEQALAVVPDDADLLARLAVERLTLGDIDGARAAARQGADQADARPAVLDRLGFVFSRTGDFDLALAHFRRAAAGAPDNPAILRNLAWGAQYTGDFDEAERALRQALAVDPDDDKAWFSLSGLPGWRASPADVGALEALLARVSPDSERSLGAGHALARAHEQLGEPAIALARLIQAKAPRRRERPFDAAAALESFAAAADAYRVGPIGAGDPSTAPIFVVGPPRSGTTLMDRILSSHPRVVSIGEPRIIPRLVLRAGGVGGDGPATAEVIRRGAATPAAALGQAFIQAARVLAGPSERFVDKRPFNLLHAGFIARILPGARILRMRRNPADAVLGNFRMFFSSTSRAHDYSHDLEATARYVCGLETLSETWERELPADRYRVFDYEALVADPEGQIRAALAFCDLPFDARCLDFHASEAGVSTASAVQVREPLHPRNIGLWRRYGDGLEPALAILRQAGRL